MIQLLDVNVLVALFDPAHIHHNAAHQWFSGIRESGWATCPITENGLVRVISNPRYPGGRTTVADAANRLRQFAESGYHTPWPDDVSLLRKECIDPSHLTGHREVTDTYLLALCVHRDGALATFDRSIRSEAVPGFQDRHLTVVSAKR